MGGEVLRTDYDSHWCTAKGVKVSVPDFIKESQNKGGKN